MPDQPGAAPVFVDPTGRRRRTIRTTAVVGAFGLLGVTVLIVAALLGAPLGPLNPLPEPASGPPAAVEPVQVPAQTPGDGDPATTSTTKPGSDRVAAPGATTTTTSPAGGPTTTTTTTKGNKPTTPPGRPSDLPTPPGRTR